MNIELHKFLAKFLSLKVGNTVTEDYRFLRLCPILVSYLQAFPFSKYTALTTNTVKSINVVAFYSKQQQ